MTAVRWKSLAVVVIDPFARTQQAATRAAAIAERCGARLTLLNVFMVLQPTAAAGARTTSRRLIADAVRERRAALEIIADRLRERGIRVRAVVRWDYPIHEGILALVRELAPDVLISESHRRSHLGRLLLANTDWELMRGCPCPLWLVRSPRQPRRLQVLVAVDPRHAHAKPAQLDDRLLSAARSLVRQFDGEVSVVHVHAGDDAQSVDGLRVEVLELATHHGVSAQQCDIRAGDIAKGVSSVAKARGADVLVMGVVSRSLPQRAVIGSSAERVIDRIACDLLVVKPAGFRIEPVKRRKPALWST